MSDITRLDISAAMKMANVPAQVASTVAERNEARRQAVVEFLKDKPNSKGTQGSIHDMILSDLENYPEWESEEPNE